MNRSVICGLVLAMTVAGLEGTDAAEPVSDAELRAFKSRFERVRAEQAKKLEALKEDLEKADDALKVDQLKKAARPGQIAYLRFLLMAEEDLSLLAAPEDKVDEQGEPREFSSQERKKVGSLRREIREAERARIKAELKEGRGFHSNEKTEQAIYRDEQSLDSLYDRNVSKLKRDIAKGQRDLSKEKFSDRRDDDKVAELEKEIEAWEKELGAIHRYVYGIEPGLGFEPEVKDAAQGGTGALMAELAGERTKILKFLRGEEEGGEGEKKGGVVGGSFLYSSNLGVVLDVSGSMTPHIEKLKKEIAETFEAPRYQEVQGCRIDGRAYGGLELARLLGSKPDTMSVIEDLVVVDGVDTVYWFCDLRDGFDFAGLRRLRTLLLRGGSAFHVKSMAMRPERELKPLIDDFQG